jgi:hypothetical protein
MMVVLAIFLALFNGSNALLDDGSSGGPSVLGLATPSAGTPARAPAATRDDGTSGGPSLVAPIAPPRTDGGSGGPSHP